MVIPKGKIHVGFSGTRKGMTMAQGELVERLVAELAAQGALVSHDGDCIGADEQFHRYAVARGAWTIGHPPINPTFRAHMAYDEMRPLEAYLHRNRKIVAEAAVMICAPEDMSPASTSGTWATIRYARAAGIPLTIVNSSGSAHRTDDWP